MKTVEILYITHNRLGYTKKTLPKLLDLTDYPLKLTIVDNNSTDGTIEYIKHYENHSSVKCIIYNSNNEGLSGPTNDFWLSATSDYVGKVDNDTLLEKGWLNKLIQVYERNLDLRLGVLAGCAFRKGDFDEEDAKKKLLIREEIVQQVFVGGCCYIIDRRAILKEGTLRVGEKKVFGWTEYQSKLTQKGYINGYIFPFMYVDHMDDPRSSHFDNSEDNILRMQKVMKERNINVTKTNTDGVVQWIRDDGINLLNPIPARHWLAKIISINRMKKGIK